MTYKNCQILVIADSESYFKEVEDMFSDSEITVQWAHGSNLGLEMAKRLDPEGVVLDLELEGIDGIRVCQEIRSKSKELKPFILFYTTEEGEYMQIAALNAGADDYIIKPVRKKILASRIKALFKRNGTQTSNEKGQTITIGNLSIDRETYRVKRNKEEIVLPRKEFELLYLFASKPCKVYSRRELSKLVWGLKQEVKGRTIDVHIWKIREKLGEELIKTVKGIGYKWIEEKSLNI